MERFKFTTIGHRGIRLCSPLEERRLDELVALLALDSGARVLDLGAGKAEFCLRLIARYGCAATAVEMNPSFVEEARQEATRQGLEASLTLLEADASTFTTQEPFDLVLCIGARPQPDYRENLLWLMQLVRPGGLLLVGEGYWRVPPSEDFLAFLGDEDPDSPGRDFGAHIQMAQEAGLISLYATSSSVQEFDFYDGRYTLNLERYIAENPEDPDIEAIRTRIRSWRDATIRWGRTSMGFGWYLYSKP